MVAVLVAASKANFAHLIALSSRFKVVLRIGDNLRFFRSDTVRNCLVYVHYNSFSPARFNERSGFDDPQTFEFLKWDTWVTWFDLTRGTGYLISKDSATFIYFLIIYDLFLK